MEGPSPRHEPSFLWFTRGGRAYLVVDRDALARVGRAHDEDTPEQTLGERLRALADELLQSGAARPTDP
jgi:hypothetical protein